MHLKKILGILTLALLFTFLFYRQNLGLNAFIFEGVFLVYLAFKKEIRLKTPLQITLFGGLVLSLIGILTVNSGFAIKVNFLLLFLFVGSLNYEALRSPITAICLAAHNFWMAQGIFFYNLSTRFKLFGFMYRLRYYLIPLAVILVFIAFYSNANPLFEGMVGNFAKWFDNNIWEFLKDINFVIFLTFVFGLIISAFLYQRKASQTFIANPFRIRTIEHYAESAFQA